MPIAYPTTRAWSNFRRQARALQRAARAGDAGGAATCSPSTTRRPVDAGRLPLSAAQLVVARGYGFSQLAEAAALPRSGRRAAPRPDRRPRRSPAGDLADEFCRLACLVYSEVDGPERWARARVAAGRAPGAGDAKASPPRPRPPIRMPSRRHWRRDPGAAEPGDRAAPLGPAAVPDLLPGAVRRRTRRPVPAQRASCCSTPAPTRTPGTCGAGCRPRSRRSPACSARASRAPASSPGTRTRCRWPGCC